MSPLAQILLAGLGTYLIRISGVVVAGRAGPPSPGTTATLGLIAPAVLAALVADRLLLEHGELAVQLDWWLAGVAAGLVSWRTRSAGLTVAVGMVVVWVVSALG